MHVSGNTDAFRPRLPKVICAQIVLVVASLRAQRHNEATEDRAEGASLCFRGYGRVWVCPCVLGLTSASRDCLWLTSCLLMGASCCSVLRLLVSARVSRANFVHPARARQKRAGLQKPVGASHLLRLACNRYF